MELKAIDFFGDFGVAELDFCENFFLSDPNDYDGVFNQKSYRYNC